MDLQKAPTVGVIAIPLALGAFALYKHINAELTPGEGDLVVNVNTVTTSELETIHSIRPYVKADGQTSKR